MFERSLRAACLIVLCVLAAAIFVATVVLSRGGGTSEAASTVQVATQDFHFAPQVVTISTGDTVRWVGNNFGGGDISAHTSTSDPGVTPAWRGVLNVQNPNATFDVTFNAPGTYTYLCEVHPTAMTGTVIVADPPTSTPTSTPTRTPTPTPSPTPTPPPNAPPAVSGTTSPIGGPDPLLVTFDWSVSDADGDPISAIIAWGDASSDVASISPPYPLQQHAHTYASPGSYTAKISVNDGKGGVASVSRTVLVGPDSDADQFPDAYDNCAFLANPGQQNSDAAIDNGPGVTAIDDTVPNAAADIEGDACETDGDTDNDGRSDADEVGGIGCGGAVTDHGGDVTNDDDGDGNPVPPMGTDGDGSDDGPSWDSDADGVRDGAECASGSNPKNRLVVPPLAPDHLADSDGDGLKNGWERNGWGTNPSVTDTDGDGLGDCKEALDVDGNGVVNSTGDFIFIANAVFKPTPPTKSGDFDLDKNGMLNSTGDFVNAAALIFVVGACD